MLLQTQMPKRQTMEHKANAQGQTDDRFFVFQNQFLSPYRSIPTRRAADTEIPWKPWKKPDTFSTRYTNRPLTQGTRGENIGRFPRWY